MRRGSDLAPMDWQGNFGAVLRGQMNRTLMLSHLQSWKYQWALVSERIQIYSQIEIRSYFKKHAFEKLWYTR